LNQFLGSLKTEARGFLRKPKLDPEERPQDLGYLSGRGMRFEKPLLIFPVLCL
jgi:hypothetical protein